MNNSRKTGLLICLPVYALALAGAIVCGIYFSGNGMVLAAAAGDLAATIIIFAFSMIFNNSSIYDPYWSLAPVAIAVYWFLNGTSVPVVRQVAVLVILLAWASRLTYNCFRRWRSIKQEDWRYVGMRPAAGACYWPLSFFGFHLFPTIIVFLGCLPLYVSLSGGSGRFEISDVLAILVSGTAIYIETISDRQMDSFRSNPQNSGKNIDSGLWAYSRHPNYFGEVMFWWGLYLFGLSADPGYWWTIIGPAAITLLFVFVSVPMMDRHMLKRRENYADRMGKISALVPWFRGRGN